MMKMTWRLPYHFHQLGDLVWLHLAKILHLEKHMRKILRLIPVIHLGRGPIPKWVKYGCSTFYGVSCWCQQVLKGTHNLSQKIYAVKIVDKKLLMRENKVATAHAEKNALTKLGGPKSHPGIIKLQWTFQDEWSLCETPL